MEKTAVEWLVEKQMIIMGMGSVALMKEHIERAKEMEREQIVDSWMDGNKMGWAQQTDWEEDAEKYYEQTYGKP